MLLTSPGYHIFAFLCILTDYKIQSLLSFGKIKHKLSCKAFLSLAYFWRRWRRIYIFIILQIPWKFKFPLSFLFLSCLPTFLFPSLPEVKVRHSQLLGLLPQTINKGLNKTKTKPCSFFFFFFFKFYFIFKLYITVLVLPNIKMNPPQVYICSPSWTLLPPPSPDHPSGLSQCTSPKHPVSCTKPGLATRFIYDIIHHLLLIDF